MLDIFLQNNDFTIDESRTLKLIANSDCVKQRLYIAMKLGYGEFFYNVSQGVPYTEFEKNCTLINIIGIWMLDYIYGLSGVVKVTDFEPSLDQNRSVGIKCNVEDEFGKILQLVTP
jgi:hypothetical protein